ncbi:MAG: type 2 isopentenyl-diphosphate Delta-isomerase [Candidatus Thorarchaeota archaeon]
MIKENEVILLKLGGSLLTDKNKPFSIREDVIENSINQIIRSKQKLILIHGGGSFGHPVAKKYSISKGYNKSIKNQVLGLSETHEAMNKLNTLIVNKFLEKQYPVIQFQTSSIFFKNSQKISVRSIEVIEAALNIGLLPILYGDIILDSKGSFSIISGDQIILELCQNLQKYNVSKVIFAIEKDGIFIQSTNNDKSNVILVSEITSDKLDDLKLAKLGEKIDVTGSIRGKIDVIKKICIKNIPVQIINGLKEDYIMNALNSKDVISTKIDPAKRDKIEDIKKRKFEHLKIPLEFDVQHSENYFKEIQLLHHPFPEINFSEIDLSTKFFSKMISAPICIAAITGGHPLSRDINEILAKAAEAENVIMSVGSQRAGLADPSTIESFRVVRKFAPNIPIIGNIGVGQISDPTFDINSFERCIEMVNADSMAIHFNALHELVQDKGDISYKNFRKNFEKIRAKYALPIIAKEVGTGFNQDSALVLDELGFDGFDVGGTGGTSFAAIESMRDNFDNDMFSRNPADVFREWGIPTPVSIINVRKVSDKIIIATGGLKTGIDIAKSIALGADISGFAYKFLLSAWEDLKNHKIDNTIREIKTLKNELRSSLWLMNLKNISELKSNQKKYVILGRLYQWLNQ